MDFLNELVGFIIVLFALLFPLFKRLLSKKKENVQETQEEEDMHSLPQTLHMSSESEPKSFQKPFVPFHVSPFKSSLETYHPQSTIEGRQLTPQVDPHFEELTLNERFRRKKKFTQHPSNYLKQQLQRYPEEQKMVIYSEIFSRKG